VHAIVVDEPRGFAVDAEEIQKRHRFSPAISWIFRLNLWKTSSVARLKFGPNRSKAVMK